VELEHARSVQRELPTSCLSVVDVRRLVAVAVVCLALLSRAALAQYWLKCALAMSLCFEALS